MKVLVSACLIGVRCRYDGRSSIHTPLLEKLEGSTIIPLCPEQLGGLPTPREEAMIVSGTALDVLAGKARVHTKSGKDVTKNFLKGAKKSYQMARTMGIKRAYLKNGSPSCGVTKIYSKDGRLIEGNGVTSAFLSMKGMKLIPV